ncbi:hypothetical protein AR687_21380 [Flavobacteriaceae bacterium CRH]|nr:hypothetical protein AR687_21380 [Flavobacteriaceae bacterium CRH]
MEHKFSEIVKVPLLETKVNIINKEQYILIMKAIVRSLFKRVKSIFIAIVFFIIFLLTWKLASNTHLRQIIMTISIIIFIITTVISIKSLLRSLAFDRFISEKAQKLQYPTLFVYRFYKDGIYTKNQELEGFFNYNSFQSIGVYEEGIQFLFRFKNSSIGWQLYKTYQADSFWMPISSLEKKEAQEVIAFVKKLKEAHVYH